LYGYNSKILNTFADHYLINQNYPTEKNDNGR
jgi:hypothetical protein